tara:strand:- start:651 stop:1652 length:1002 start_codon:yes stop_codon:yes gene_type:complete
MNKTIDIIAEIGSVHDGSIETAIELVKMASDIGVNTVKFQTHIAEAETIPSAPSPEYFKDEPRYEYFKRTSFNLSEWKEIKSECDANNVEFLSSPFSHEAVDLLETVGVKKYKVASGEVTNIPLLEYISKTRKGVLLSSGMSNWEELDKAVETIMKTHSNITIMQCTSQYPCDYSNVGLNVIEEMSSRYKLPIGFSDHTQTNYAAFAAASIGVSSIEKHLTFSKDMYGSDAKFATEPDQFRSLVQGIRAIEEIRMNDVEKDDIKKFENMKEVFQKSIVSKLKIKRGDSITNQLVAFKKPGTGIPPARLKDIIGKKTTRDIEKDVLIKYSDLED